MARFTTSLVLACGSADKTRETASFASFFPKPKTIKAATESSVIWWSGSGTDSTWGAGALLSSICMSNPTLYSQYIKIMRKGKRINPAIHDINSQIALSMSPTVRPRFWWINNYVDEFYPVDIYRFHSARFYPFARCGIGNLAHSRICNDCHKAIKFYFHIFYYLSVTSSASCSSTATSL